MDYASRWARFLALVIDFIVLVIVWAILAAVGILDFQVFLEEDLPETADPLFTLSRDTIIMTATQTLYYIGLTVAFGATLGKMALSIRVTDADGGKPEAGTVVAREVIGRAGYYIVQVVLFVVLGAALSVWAASFIAGLAAFLVFLIIFLRILVDDRRQGWHDKIGKTFVVKAQ